MPAAPNLYRRLAAPIRSYAHNPDPLVQGANMVALAVASSQPFYPLYVWWSVSDTVWPVFFTWLSTPFFLAVPWLARRNAFAGRAALPLVGIANTLMCAILFGTASGVELFWLPTLTTAFIFFRPNERWFGLAVTAALFLAFTVLRGWYGASPGHVWTADELSAFVTLNAISAGGLTVVLAWMVMGREATD
ncbi:MAG TPA: hypothetical protein VMF90_10105 [Rhizobiaceae bacterium]|nr:hypothetical protein [Rhizobiaceae bacterium]